MGTSIAVLILAGGVWLTACTGSRERAQETPPQTPTEQVPSDQEATLPPQDPAQADPGVQGADIPGVGHGSGVPGYDETESAPSEESVMTTEVPQATGPATGASEPFFVTPESGVLETEIPTPENQRQEQQERQDQPGSETLQPEDETTDESATEIPEPEARSGPRADELGRETLQPEDADTADEGVAETAIPKENKEKQLAPTERTRHSDFGRQVIDEDLIPDSTTEESGLPEEAEQQ